MIMVEVSFSDFKKIVVSKKLKKIVSDLYRQNDGMIFIRYGYIE